MFEGGMVWLGLVCFLLIPVVAPLIIGLIRLLNEHVLDPYDPEEETWRAAARRTVLVQGEPDRPRRDDGRIRPAEDE